MKLELDQYHTEVLEDTLIQYIRHAPNPEKVEAAGRILGMVAYAKRRSK